MTIAFISATVDLAFSTNSTTINKPAGVSPGDYVIWIIANYASANFLDVNLTIDTPAGFVPISGAAGSELNTNVNGVNRNQVAAVFIRKLDGTEGATFSDTGTSTGSTISAAMASIMLAYSGVDPTTPIDTANTTVGSNTGVASITVPGLTAANAGTMVVAGLVCWETDRGPLSGLTEVINSGGDGLTADDGIFPAGATGSLSCSSSTSETFIVPLIALKPAAGATLTPGVPTPGPLPKARRAPQPGPWEPLGALPAAALTPLVSTPGPVPKVRRAPRVDSWDPIPDLPELVFVGWGFSLGASGGQDTSPPPVPWDPLPALIGQTVSPLANTPGPLPRAPRAPRIDNWDPLPAVIPAPATSLGWGFSESVSSLPASPRVEGWEPLDTLGAPTVDFETVLPSKLRRYYPDGWMPIAQLNDPWIDCTPPVVPLRARAKVDAWDPLPALPVTSLAAVVDVASPVPRRLARAATDAWDPIPDLPALVFVGWAFSLGASGGQDTGPLPGSWEPIGPLPSPLQAFDVDPASPLPPPPKRARVDAWDPIPALATGTSSPSVEPQPPQRVLPRRSPVDSWDPLGPIPPAPVGVFSQEPKRVLPARARFEPWEPQPTLNDSAVFCESPRPRGITRARCDGWDPLPALIPIPPANWGFDQQPLAHGERKIARPDYWDPLGPIAVRPTFVPQPYLLAAV